MAEPPKPAGFGNCPVCAYRDSGTPRICSDCATKTLEALSARRCLVCDLKFAQGESKCGNPVCNWNDRYFDRNRAIGMRSGVLERAISAYKYRGVKAWGIIFARVVLGHLEKHSDDFEEFDLIVASPSFTGEGATRNWSHTALVLESAGQLAPGDWPFDIGPTPAIVKKTHTEPMASLKTWQERHAMATGPFRASLEVPDPARTKGKRILVYDDIFTDGQTLNEVARALRYSGRAKLVSGITLARQPWRK